MRETLRAYRTLMALCFRAAPWQATGQLVTGLLMALAAPVTAYGAKLLVDAVVDGDLSTALGAGAVVSVTFAVTLVITLYYVDFVFGVFERAGGEADRRLMRLMGGTDGLAHHERPDYLDQVQLIRERRRDLAAAVNATAGLLRNFLTVGLTGVLLAAVDPLLAALPAVAVLSLWLARRGRNVEVAAEEATAATERLRRHLFDVATAAPSGKELRIFGTAETLRARHHAVSAEVVRERDRATWRATALQVVDGLITGLAYAGAVALVLVRAVGSAATAGDVVLVVALAAQLSFAVYGGAIYAGYFLRVMTLARRFVWLERYARDAVRRPAAPVAPPARLRDGIVLRDVSFAYPGTERPVLERVSLRLPAGAVVALVGENGAGKTTLVKLLCGFYRPDEGEVLVDGVDLERIPPHLWRARVAAAFQDFARFEFTAGETVGVGDLPRVDDEAALRAALRRGDATAVVDDLPRGLATPLGARWDGGVDLSGGQWQRLALARGLMREDPLLVVFDEPTAALDPQAEHALFERFAEAAREGRRHGTVTLLVSHRFSTVRMADLIVVLDSGRVREFGSHDELVAADGLYAELYQLQSAAYC